jgi:energy-coupling factor transporter ATP-binding protein EcfA2
MIIGLAGPKGVGKSTLASKLTELLPNSTVLPFAAPLKAMAEAFYRSMGLPEEEVLRRVYGDRKEMRDYLGERLVTPRQVMQTLGTEWGRGTIGKTIWTGIWLDRARSETSIGRSVIVDDVRFEDEVEAVQLLGGRVFDLYAPELKQTGDRHASERGVQSADFRVDCRRDDAADRVLRFMRAMKG